MSLFSVVVAETFVLLGRDCSYFVEHIHKLDACMSHCHCSLDLLKNTATFEEKKSNISDNGYEYKYI
jgi:hypothetical protein